MRLHEFSFLTDENFDPEVTAHLRRIGWDARTASEEGLLGKPDEFVVRAPHAAGRVVLTHDADFGWLAIVAKEPCLGVVYLRPGHARAEFTIATINVLISRNPDLSPPFVLVARRVKDRVTVRIRRL